MNLRVFIMAAALVSIHQPTAFAQITNRSDQNEKVFVGYVFHSPAGVNFKLYTHLCHAFITAGENGVIRTNATIPSTQLVAEAHRSGVKVLLSLGGWGWDKQFAAIIGNVEAEERYLRSVMAIVDSFDYDGIDLDWEYPDTPQEVAGFGRLCRSFRKELNALGSKKNRQMVQTMAASSMPATLAWLPNNILLETLDWINVMTYDMAGEWTDYAGHHAPMFASSKQPGVPRSSELSISYLLKKGIPADRLALGLPLYGKGFHAAEPYAAVTNRTKAVRPPGGTYSKVLELQTKHGWRRYWDNETKSPWLLGPDGAGVIGYDDPESIALKTAWAMNNGLRGVFFWEVNGDRLSDGSNPLQESSRQKFNEALKNKN